MPQLGKTSAGSGVYQRASVAARFWKRVNKDGPVHPTLGKCWAWRNGTGRGNLCTNYKCELAYRISWRLHKGEIPDGLQVLHRCDNGNCVNPDHLFLGTPKDNMRDCANKGRLNPGVPDNRGERNGQCVLSDEDVKVIRFWYRKRGVGKHSPTYLASLFGVTAAHIRCVATGKRRGG